MNGRSEQELQEEIEELRSEVGDTVQALVHKADVAARAKQRGNELKEEAIERGSELGFQVLERGSELGGQLAERSNQLKERAIEWGNELRDQVSVCSGELRNQVSLRGSELRDQAVETVEWTREVASQVPRQRWVLAGVALALITFTAVLRRVRSS